MIDKPIWIQRMENGTIAEARTKAFLLDRFWILERSVDIQGADFIIQRRITSESILDASPPRFGIIQVKYYQDEATSQYIHYDYVCDINGNPRGEFYLIAHTGIEDKIKKYLISAKEIAEQFSLSNQNGTKMYYLPGKKVLSSRHEIVSNERALDKIEHALKIADFMKNRRFLSMFLPSYHEFQRDNIDLEYLIEFDNWWGDIPDGIYKTKTIVKSLMQDIEDLMYYLDKVLKETNPEIIMNTLEKIPYKYNEAIGLSNIYDPALHSTVLQHKSMYEDLNDKGLLDKFLLFRKNVEDYIISDLSTKAFLDNSLVYVISVTYNFTNLQIYDIKSALVPLADWGEVDEKNKYAKVLQCEKGFIRAFFVLGVFFWEQKDYKGNDIERKSQIREGLGSFKILFMDELYNLLSEME